MKTFPFLSAAPLSVLSVHGLLLVVGAALCSPTPDETRHLAAGLAQCKRGDFWLNRGNPPLTGLAAGLAVILAQADRGFRPTVDTMLAGGQLGAYGADLVRVTLIARISCIGFALLGAWICYRWSRELHGAAAGLLAISLWCFSPNVLGHGCVISGDVPASAAGAGACYLLWRWFREPTAARAALAGLALGVAELTKFVCLIWYPLWAGLWIVWRLSSPDDRPRGWVRREGVQLAGIFLLSAYVINVGYGFEGTFTALAEHRLEREGEAAGEEPEVGSQKSESRPEGSQDPWWASIPVPLPVNYVRGIHEIAQVVEPDDQWCYLGGDWKRGGWWYYYLFGLGVKLPLGTLVLFALALGLNVRGWFVRSRETRVERREPEATGERPRTTDKSITWRDDMVLLVPIVVILVWVTWATFNHQYHVRYAFPVLPFVFIFASRVAVERDGQKSEIRGQMSEGRLSRLMHRARRGRFWLQVIVIGALGWNVVSLARVYPHCLSYFNELAGGPERGHEHLLSSNIDWGQDLLFLKDWYDEHPEARPFHLAYFGPMEPAVLGIEYERIPRARELREDRDGARRAGMTDAAGGRVGNPSYVAPGWYALSIRMLKERTGQYAHFMKLKPVAMAGYSIYIYGNSGF